ncbi:MAG: hypothetical protein OXI81_09010 [Paracoccaceae bacterium]|nr:hypothetical protein [Paracoccaceae bacterium]
MNGATQLLLFRLYFPSESLAARWCICLLHTIFGYFSISLVFFAGRGDALRESCPLTGPGININTIHAWQGTCPCPQPAATPKWISKMKAKAVRTGAGDK